MRARIVVEEYFVQLSKLAGMIYVWMFALGKCVFFIRNVLIMCARQPVQGLFVPQIKYVFTLPVLILVEGQFAQILNSVPMIFVLKLVEEQFVMRISNALKIFVQQLVEAKYVLYHKYVQMIYVLSFAQAKFAFPLKNVIQI
jgi:uncharacterized membrane protein YvlD (DUF360 family)